LVRIHDLPHPRDCYALGLVCSIFSPYLFPYLTSGRNMFLAAAPYFQYRFQDDARILSHFQPAITSVACVTNLATTLFFNFRQSAASYPRRIVTSLILNIAVFAFLSLSTLYMREISSAGYLTFILIMVFLTSCATGLLQNGAFAFAAGFGRQEYTQAIMNGQAVSGVLPSLAQVVSVLAVPAKSQSAGEDELKIESENTATSAFFYFLTATIVSIITLVAVFPLIRRHKNVLLSRVSISHDSEDGEQPKHKAVSQITLLKKLHWHAIAIFLCFAITMFFPVFTQKIVSVRDQTSAPRLFQPDAFIGLGFLFWNSSDLLGRTLAALPNPLKRQPLGLFIFSLLRIGFVPLYFLCNIQNNGAIINSDTFYLFIVQGGFGVTNGLLASYSMTQSIESVAEGEREAAGSFMVVNLMAGLMVGSLMSFTVAGVS